MTWTTDYVEYVKQIARELDVISLNTPIHNPEQIGPAEAELGDYVPDPEPSPMEKVLEIDRRETVQKFVNRYLSEKERLVINSRFGLKTGIPMTLEEVGEELHITRERVRQIEARGIRKLRCAFSRCRLRKEDI